VQLASLARPLFLAAISLSALAGSSQAERQASVLIPDVLPLPADSNAQFFVQADAKGNLFLLRGDTLDVLPVRHGRTESPKRLHLPIPTENRFSSASMNQRGDSWALVESNRVLFFKDGRLQKTPETGWIISSAAMIRDTPTVSVLPMSVGRPRSAGRPTTPPLILKLGSNGWEPQVAGTFPQRAKNRDPINVLYAEHSIKLAPGSRGKIWAVNPYSGRIVRYTSAGRSDLVIVFGTGSPKYRGDEETLRKRFVDRLREKGYSSERARIGVLTAQVAIQGFTESPDGSLYALLDRSRVDNGPVLVRYNAVVNAVESTPVRFSGEGEVRMAAGHEGLAWTVEGGNELWQLSWPLLEAADWKELENVRLLSGGPGSVPFD
jgi:hypothetical protein